MTKYCLIFFLLVALLFTGCTPYWEYQIQQDGIAVHDGDIVIVFSISNNYVESNGGEINEIIIAALEKSLKEATLCPKGYIIHSINRARNLDYTVALDCKT